MPAASITGRIAGVGAGRDRGDEHVAVPMSTVPSSGDFLAGPVGRGRLVIISVR